MALPFSACIACGEEVERDPILRGSRQYRNAAASWDYELLRCKACRMGRLFPAPDAKMLEEMYAGDYGVYRSDAAITASKPSQRLKLKAAHLAAFANVNARPPLSWMAKACSIATEYLAARSVPLTTWFPLTQEKPAAILDYGCGSGWWLLRLKDAGYTNLWAFDVAHPGLDVLQQAGIRVVTDDLTALPDGTFACIRLHHVLEHLLDPVVVLEKLARKLRPGGSIVIEVPNFASWSAENLGERWEGLRLPFHLSHFTVRSLQKMALRVGLQVEEAQFLPSFSLAKAAFPRASKLHRYRHYTRQRRAPSADCVAVKLSISSEDFRRPPT